ncbi:hypothetical protein RZN22_17975 [Bacillaceae bacterium S4-13-58]
MSTGNNGNIYGAPFINDALDDNRTKNAHDRYDVYVNKSHVGQKVLLTQTEDVTDIKDYLDAKGFNGVEGYLDGDHYVIQTNDPAEAERIKDILSVYLGIR